MNHPARPVTLQLAEFTVLIERKPIRHARLRVLPPDAAIRLSLPLLMPLSEAEAFLQRKLAWLRDAHARILARPPATAATFNDGDHHEFWGRSLPLRLSLSDGRPRAALLEDCMLLLLPPDHSPALRGALIDHWYRVAVNRAVPALLSRWQPRLGVQIHHYSVIKMRTRWGSCTPSHGTMRLNSLLARFDAGCLEYVVVHELAHLLEANHSPRFYAILDQQMPDWQQWRRILNPPRVGLHDDADST